MNGDILLVVGNGLAIDQRQTMDELADWDTRSPLSWRVPNPSAPGLLLDALPSAKRHIDHLRSEAPSASDFDLLTQLAQRLTTRDSHGQFSDGGSGIVELRHLILQSFVEYSDRATEALDPHSWKWGEWITAHAPRTLSAVSFNYDLVLETLLEAHEGVTCRAAFHGETSGLVVAKPHGSIDYAPSPRAFDAPSAKYPLAFFLENNDFPLVRVPKADLMQARHAADVVIPGERSRYRDFQWVTPGRVVTRFSARRCRYLVLLGLSYWPVDRHELDEITDAAPPSTTIVMANPAPDPTWLGLLKKKFEDVRVWSSPEEIPDRA